MDETAVKLIDKLPDWYLMVLIPALIYFVFFYVIPHIKRDGKGRIYWHDDRKESIKQTKILQTILKTVSVHTLDICKLNVHNPEMPTGERMASGIRYINAGGNGECKHYILEKLRPLNAELYDQLEKMISENDGGQND